MFVPSFQLFRPRTGSVSRLCQASLAAGGLAMTLFLLPLVLHSYFGTPPLAITAYGIAWLGSTLMGIVALYTGYVSQWRLKPGERHSMVYAVSGGALGLASLMLVAVVLSGLLFSAMAG